MKNINATAEDCSNRSLPSFEDGEGSVDVIRDRTPLGVLQGSVAIPEPSKGSLDAASDHRAFYVPQ